MNYFELINKCLVELNYRKVTSFSELSKNDHEKIKNILNIINSEVCGFDNWSFLLRKTNLTLPANCPEIENTINGRINSVFINNIKYEYCGDFEKFILNTQPSKTFSAFNDKLLFPLFNQEKTVEIIYYTNFHAQDSQGSSIPKMSLEQDSSIIPDAYAEPLLVYGTCMRVKANPEHKKFNYWYGMYKDALANMRSKIGTNALETPEIKLSRN
ncbi:MAG TPA: hypothetical protein PLG15_00130 [Candidatus Gastranaerophilaceae bacterium]|nr:hypothetical protein [Candidatus Gastranaerophilaceae bacterium]HPT40773.1 hypothetical protein [Candidatus Gastranaerophilaceae bacterium]